MLTRFKQLGFMLLFCFNATISASATTLSPEVVVDVQQAWKLLDYVATDYADAVHDGIVTDRSEYEEQQEFSETVTEILNKLPQTPSLSGLLQQAQLLATAVNQKVSAQEIDRRAHELAEALLKAYPIPSAPDFFPDLVLGQKTYQMHCADCHGAKGAGDGPTGINLDPPPIDFTDVSRADLRSPMSLYQATAQGIPDTGMVAWSPTLTDEELWAVAYYTGTLAYPDSQSETTPAGQIVWQENPILQAYISDLQDLSQMRAVQLSNTLTLDKARSVLGWLRANPHAVEQAPQGLALARAKLQASLLAFQQNQPKEAIALALSAYLDGVEPEEPRLNIRNRALRSDIETAMGAYRSVLSRAEPITQAQTAAHNADQLLAQGQEVLSQGNISPWAAFLGALTILAREGIEALLVVVALLAFLQKSGRTESKRYVHYGWIGAIIAGVGTWVIATWFIAISGASREVTEGLSSLFAAAVLIGVGLWMHGKSIGGRWQHYLNQKMSAAMQRRSAWFLFILSFISVYREVFETILFYAALWSDGQHIWILLGMLSAIVLLVIIAWFMLRTSRRLPLGQFFLVSSVLIAALAFIMTGKGVSALQEAGWINVTLADIPTIDWLGIYPTQQSFVSQLVVLVIIVGGFVMNHLRNQRHSKAD